MIEFFSLNRNKIESALTNNKPLLVSSVGLAVVSFIIFNQIYTNCDIALHSATCIDYMKGEKSLPGNFLYYFLTALASCFNPHLTRISSTALLAVFVITKFIVVFGMLHKWESNSHNDSLIILVSLALIFVSSIYVPQILYHRAYLGSFTPNIWHNSTTIAVMPFSLLLFLVTCSQIHTFTWKRFFIICAMIAINAFIKPSYLFVYIFALPLAALLYHGLSRKLFVQILPSFVALAGVFVLNHLVYEIESSNPNNNSIAIKPFFVYSQFFSNPKPSVTYLLFFASVITSFLFPLYVFIVKGVKRKDVYSMLSLISVVGALVISVFIVETGERTLHGNFFWQVYICSFILFLVAAKISFKDLVHNLGSLNLKNINMIQILFGLHLFFGVIYVFRLVLFQSWI